MKAWKILLPVILCLFFVFSICSIGSGESEEYRDIKKNIVLLEGVKNVKNWDGAIESLINEIVEDHADLAAHFAEGNFKAMGEIFGDQGFIITPEYEMIFGRKNIEQYFKDAKEDARNKYNTNDISFEIKTTKVVVSANLGEVEISASDKRNMYSIETFEFRILKKLKDGAIMNQTAGGGLGRWHQEGCPWL